MNVNAQARNPMKVAAIHAAVRLGDVAIVEILLQYGGDPNLNQQTISHAAAWWPRRTAMREIVSLLKEHGAH